VRLDLYLKTSRIIKRRTVANEACDAGRVLINGKTAKPGAEVKVGDRLEIRFGGKVGLYEVLSIQPHAPKAEAVNMYRVIAEPPEGF
jgi:ribosomal 50S subunit-recycling heat shock protein